MCLYEYGTQVWLNCFRGTDNSPGQLELTCLLHSNSQGTKATALFRSPDHGHWEELCPEISSVPMAKISSALDSVIRLGSGFQVRGNLDTSLGWVQCVLHIRKTDRVWTFDLPMRLSGFSGNGSTELDSLISALLSAVGLDHWLRDRLRRVAIDA